MTRSFSNRIFGGVCGGLATALPLNAWIWRFLFILLAVLSSGVGAIVYVLLWWLFPLESPLRRGAGSITSLIGILVGIALLALWFARTALGIEAFYWPIAFLVLAVVFLLKQIFTGSWENIALAVVALLIPLGFLLQATNSLQAGFADIILRAWPAILIFLGLSIALRYRMRFGSWLALVVSVVLVAALANFAYSSRVDTVREDNQIVIAVPNLENDGIAVISEGVTTMLIEVNTLDTDVQISVSEDSSRLVQGEFVGSNNSEINLAYNEEGQVASVLLQENQAAEFPRLEDIGRGRLNLQIPANIAVGLRFTGLSGNVNLDMGALDLEQLIFTLTAGDVLVTLPSYQPLSPSVQESNGDWVLQNGDLTVLVPQDLGLRLSLSRSNNTEPRGGHNFDDLFFQLLLEGNDYILASRQFDNADYRMRYRVDVFGGDFSVETNE